MPILSLAVFGKDFEFRPQERAEYRDLEKERPRAIALGYRGGF